MVFLNIVLPVFLIIALGFGIQRIQFVDKFFLEKISHLAYFVALPALLIWKIGTASFDLTFNPRLILGSYLTVAGCGLCAYIVARLLRLPLREVGSFIQGSFWGNMTYIGLPILLAAYGEVGLQRGGVLIAFMTPLINAAVVLALPLALITLGGTLSLEKIKKDYKATALACLFKLFLIVGWGWLLFEWLGVKGLDFKVGIILRACPTAFSSYLLSSKLGADKSLMSSDIMVSTLLSMGTLSFWLWRLN